jgi:hypothetical protein
MSFTYFKLSNGKEGSIWIDKAIVDTICEFCQKDIKEKQDVYQADGIYDCCSLDHAKSYLNNHIDDIILNWNWDN